MGRLHMTEEEMKRIRYASVRTGKPLWCCREFRKFWFEVTGEKITIAPALVDIKTGKVVRWLDEEKKNGTKEKS